MTGGRAHECEDGQGTWDMGHGIYARRGGRAHLSTGVAVFSMKLIIFSFTFTDLDLNAKVILLTRDLTPLPSAVLFRPSLCGDKVALMKER